MKLGFSSYSVHNNREELAKLAIHRVLSEEKEACSCPLCTNDMLALVLNSLKADYIPTSEAEAKKETPRLETLPRDLFNKLMVEAYRAMAVVKENPRHEGERSPLRNGVAEILLLALEEILPRHDPAWREFDNLSQIMALALNELPPQYSTTYKGRVYSRLAEIDAGYLARVYAVVYNAINKLKEKTG
ncbi:MAG TPA: late competence development ComFB family protein [Firmicutes bacterium]|nr:late competence development ComFB family protein [Bacillota bacterium]